MTYLIILHTLNVMDKVLTFIAVGFLGVREANPLVSGLFDFYGIIPGVIIALGIGVIGIEMIHSYRNTPTWAWSLVIAVMFTVVVSNIIVIGRVLL